MTLGTDTITSACRLIGLLNGRDQFSLLQASLSLSYSINWLAIYSTYISNSEFLRYFLPSDDFALKSYLKLLDPVQTPSFRIATRAFQTSQPSVYAQKLVSSGYSFADSNWEQTFYSKALYIRTSPSMKCFPPNSLENHPNTSTLPQAQPLSQLQI